MILYANQTRLPEGSLPEAGVQTVVFIPRERLREDARTLGLDQALTPSSVDESHVNRFESHPGFDCLLLNLPDENVADDSPLQNLDIYYTKDLTVITHDPMAVVEKLQRQLDPAYGGAVLPYDKVLFTLLSSLTEQDIKALEDLEDTIAVLEDEVADRAEGGQMERISWLRRTLLAYKRSYESLLAALEDQAENEGSFLSEEQLHALDIVHGRVERLLRSALNLRDYVTQVREAYQSQMDISLNRTMKLFTVITAIFSPLTLLVGWYGMNLRMPEYGWPYGYAVVIGAAVLIIVLCLLIFRRKKWF